MKNTKKLYKITAHCGKNSHVYFVIATGSSAAEEIISSYHEKESYYDVDSFDSETIAEENYCGMPHQLFIS